MDDADATLGVGEPGRAGDGSLVVGTQAANRYRIVRFIAAGAMGEVYAAEDLVVGGLVALKVLRRELEGSTSAIERLRREIALARKVTNEHVCRLHDVGEHAGRVFLTMELLDGTTLADYHKQHGPLPADEVERLGAQLVDGLSALHREGIVHRDLKTANVLLVGERAVITDLGLARSILADGDPRLTVESGLLGTPAYMAPEQVEARPATPASDIYALGVVLYELLSGRLPWIEDTAMATATARLYKDPTPLSSVREGIPARWEAIVMRCLARDPADRFARVEDVLGARPRRRYAVTAGVAAAVVAGVAVVGLMNRSPDPSPVPQPGGDPCLRGADKLAGVWDPVTRDRAEAPFRKHGGGHVLATWKKHARQFDDIATRWAPAWDAACTTDRADPMLYSQRLVCLEDSLFDLRSFVEPFTKPNFDVEEFVAGSPAEFSIKGPDECLDIRELRVQPPPPPVENRTEVAGLKRESIELRIELRRATNGTATGVDRPALHARLDEIAKRCLALGAPAVAFEIQYWRVMFTPPGQAASRIIDDMLELAERERLDKGLVGALNLHVRQHLVPQPLYDVAAAEAALARASKIAERVGNPRSLQREIMEARWSHAVRAMRYGESVTALRGLAALYPGDQGVALRMELARFRLRHGDLDVAEATAVAREREALVGPDDGIVAYDLSILARMNAYAGNHAEAHRLAQRGVSIVTPAARDPHQRRYVREAHETAFVHAFANHRELAAHHLEAGISLRDKGSVVEAHAAFADAMRVAGRRDHAGYVLDVADRIAASDTDRGALAEVRAELALDAGVVDATWDTRLAHANRRHALLALVDARRGRAESALAHVAAVAAPEREAVHAHVLLVLGRTSDARPLLETIVSSLDGTTRGAGLAHLRLGQVLLAIDPAKAIAHLESAAWVLGIRNADAAEAGFAWARAIVATSGDRARARDLATQARDAWGAMGLTARAEPITAWLAKL